MEDTATNQLGQSERAFRIVAGDKLSLTPQMGFNDWYAYYNRVTDSDMRAAADIMVATGMAEVSNRGAEVGGNSWRTGGDLGSELNRIFEVALQNCALRNHHKPGGWNDPDYIQIGWIGNASAMGEARPAPLTPNETVAFIPAKCHHRAREWRRSQWGWV
ncbi:MAG: hypothetical protein NTW21_25175 [Verrucomicrobia bacterium]|nr:hypothetical protein [Verrucomicrobiota bacterium]